MSVLSSEPPNGIDELALWSRAPSASSALLRSGDFGFSPNHSWDVTLLQRALNDVQAVAPSSDAPSLPRSMQERANFERVKEFLLKQGFPENADVVAEQLAKALGAKDLVWLAVTPTSAKDGASVQQADGSTGANQSIYLVVRDGSPMPPYSLEKLQAGYDHGAASAAPIAKEVSGDDLSRGQPTRS
jgi:hypothetical protein